jgi:hypothetical protein
MFKYQIHKLSKYGKKAQAVYVEDILTSDVFGLMSYFPYECLLKPFLENLEQKNPQSGFQVPATAPLNIQFWKSFIWPEGLPDLNRESIEPDVVIEWENVLLIVEAKFRSATNPKELLREYLVGQSEVKSGQKAFLLLIDKNLSRPDVWKNSESAKVTITEYIRTKINELQLSDKFSPEHVATSILWTNWQSFYALLEDFEQQISGDQSGNLDVVGKRIIQDLLAILERKELLPFENLSLSEFNQYEIDINSLDGIGRIINDPIPFIEQCHLDIHALKVQLPEKTNKEAIV